MPKKGEIKPYNPKTRTFTGERLKALRSHKHITAPILAKASGLSPQVISRIEQGKTKNPDTVTISRLIYGFSKLNVTVPTEYFIPPADSLDNSSINNINNSQQLKFDIPILGSAPCGWPSQVVNESWEKLTVLAEDFEDHECLFGVKAKGDSLVGDLIGDGDVLIFTTKIQYIPDDIYIVRMGSEAVVRHVTKINDGIYRLRSSNSHYKDIVAGEDGELVAQLVEVRRRRRK